MQSELVVPDWLQKVFLGYGDPSSAHYSKMPNQIREMNFRDTFLDWDHVKESFPGKTVEPAPGVEAPVQPPYQLEFVTDEKIEEKPKKKSKKNSAAEAAADPSKEIVKVSSYRVPNMGPYPQDVPKQNHIRFTPVQGTLTDGV